MKMLNNPSPCSDCATAITRANDRRFRVPPTTAMHPGFAMTPATYDWKIVAGRLRRVQTSPGSVEFVGVVPVCRSCFERN